MKNHSHETENMGAVVNDSGNRAVEVTENIAFLAKGANEAIGNIHGSAPGYGTAEKVYGWQALHPMN